MNLSALIDEIAAQADDFLDGFTGRADARAGIQELLTAKHNSLSEAERKHVTDGVMSILEDEGFFESTPGGSSENDADSGDGDD
ncbi:MAG: hypothetical protein QM760_18420 [Nibricoccus sp.]